MLRVLVFLLLISVTPAAAEEAPTVTLTQTELKQLIDAENMKALGAYLAQRAAPIYDKINSAFTPSKTKNAPP